MISLMFIWNTGNVANEFEGVITEVTEDSIIVKSNNVGYYIKLEGTEGLNVGDTVNVVGEFDEIDPGSFDIWAKSKGAIASGYAEVEVIDHSNQYRNTIYDAVIYSETMYAELAAPLFYGMESNAMNQNTMELFSELGISHLIVISGFHISLIVGGVHKLLKKVKMNHWMSFSLSHAVTFYFIWMMFLPLTAVRAIVYSAIKYFNKHFFWNLSNNNSLALVGLIFVVMNPHSMMTMGLTLSFSISFMINLIKDMKVNNIAKSLFISIGAFLIAMPFILTFDDTFNITAPLISMVMTFPTSILYSIMIIFLPFEFMWPLIEPLCWVYLALANVMQYMIITVESSVAQYWFGFIWMFTLMWVTKQLNEEPFYLMGTYTLGAALLMVV